MSSEDKKRATLDFGNLNDTPAPPVDNDAVKAATRAAGFRETPKAAASETAAPIRAPVELVEKQDVQNNSLHAFGQRRSRQFTTMRISMRSRWLRPSSAQSLLLGMMRNDTLEV